MKTALVTGVTSQVGREVAIGLTKRGYYVIGTCPKKSLWEAKELVDTYDVEIVTCDVGDLKDTKRLVDAMEEDETIPNGRLDVLIHNEIKSYGGPAIETPDEELESIFKVNVLGQILLTKYLSNYLIRAKGIIVFSSSSSAQTPTPWMSAFGASNAAIDQYALILRSELKPFGVRVHSVVRGNVDTGNFNGVETTTVRGSHYAVDGIYESLKLVESVSSHNQTSPASYANQVLNEVLNPWWGISRFNIYGGTRAYLSHLFARYLPLWILEYSLAYQYGELKVWREIRKARRQRR